MGEQSLREKTINGMGWSAIDNIARLSMSFLIGIILARLLTPDDYGLIGILSIFISLFNTIVDSGFTNALIRKKNVSNTDYCTVFFINLFISVFMAGLLYLSADPIAVFFEREELVPLTKVLSCIVIINAFSIVQRARLVRAIDFKSQTRVTIISTLISGIVGIYMAFKGYGVWSLAAQQISFQLFSAIFLCIYTKWIPSWLFSILSFKEMWTFGWKLLASSLIDTAWREVYQVVIGKCYSSATLGLYTRAYQFSSLFSSNLTSIVQRVSYPVLSSIQGDRKRLKAAYKKVIRTTMLVSFVLMIGMAASAKSMVESLIGEKWLDCVPMLQIICLFMMLYPLHAINLNMLQVQGRSDLFLKLEIIKKMIAVIPLLLGVFIGIYWMLIGSLLTGIVAYFLNAYYSGPFLDYSIKEQIKDVLPSFGVAIVMAAPVYFMSFIKINPYLLFTIQIFVGASLSISICEIIGLPEYKEIKNIIIPALKKLSFNSY